VNVKAQKDDPGSLWHAVRQMLSTRKQNRAFGWGDFEWLECGNERIAAYRRRYHEEYIIAVHNLSDAAQTVLIDADGRKSFTDLLSGQRHGSQGEELHLDLGAYQYTWLKSD
ncbi:MAG: alpha-glucosidase C-terminal domain-containing protein, partial [Anaerolineales bacterium]